jgi:hypothetical protein
MPTHVPESVIPATALKASGPRRPRLLAGPHNSRLGTSIHSFNLPAEADVCVGATTACEAACYAKAFLFRLQRQRHLANLERSREGGFAAAVAAEVRRGLVRVIRVHASGDFYDPAYVRKWATAARACPGAAFFAYTRSWRRDGFAAALAELSALPNFSLWLSEDRDSGPSPAVPGARRAYMLSDGEDPAGVPADTDLAFRVPLPRRPGLPQRYAGPAKRANGVLVCPKEQGIPRQVELTCFSCRICFDDPRAAHSFG